MNKETDKVTEALLCTGICLIWYGITLLIGTAPLYPFLTENGVLMPVLCLVEFSVMVPLWRWYGQHYASVPSGSLRLGQLLIFALLLLLLIFCQSFYLQPESWTASQLNSGERLEAWRTLAFSLAVVILAPVAEEIVFRGFLLQALLTLVPGQRLACALLTSLIFAGLHTQYVHLLTLIALTALSLLLCLARFHSNG
ncbi:MAG TPA: CPBP family intramembrane metalloprotease, partial [Erwinia sp.]|nr:CPBP family intramembrane metalloprotease [Erwinia sp.]